jgi:hypothetical protein
MERIQDLIVSSINKFLVQHNFISPVKHRIPEDEGEDEEDEEDEQPKSTLQRPVESLSLRPGHQINHMEPGIFASLQPQVCVPQQ